MITNSTAAHGAVSSPVVTAAYGYICGFRTRETGGRERSREGMAVGSLELKQRLFTSPGSQVRVGSFVCVGT